MADRPGYFKLKRRRSRPPKRFVRCHGELVERLVTFIPGLHAGYDFNPMKLTKDERRKLRMGGWAVSAVKCIHKKAKRRRKGRKRSQMFGTAFSRVRTLNPDLERSGGIPAGHTLGLFKMYSNNQVQSSVKLKTTGAYSGAITTKKMWDQVHPGPPFRDGGPLGLIHGAVPGPELTPSSTYKSSMFSPGQWWEYTGSFVDNGEWLGDQPSNYLNALGVPQVSGFDSLAWDKTKPRLAQVSGAQFIAELRDLPRMLESTANLLHNSWRSFGGGYSSVVMHPKSVADNFLNHEFGWAPFLGDIRSFVDTFQRQNDHISNLVRDNGKWVRRKAVLKHDRTESLVGRLYVPGVEPFGFQVQGCCTDMTVDGVTCKGYMEIREVVETKTWAVGTFTYYRPEFDVNNAGFASHFTTLQRLMTLYGLRINPSVVYKVTPWTWAIDWASSMGSHLERLNDYVSDGIVSRGLCIMQSMERYREKTSVVNFASGARVFKWRRYFATKARKMADSPYGFNRPWNELSPRQLAILGAVGISRRDSGFISRG